MKHLFSLFLLLPTFLFAQKNINLENSGELIQKGIAQYEKEEYYESIRTYSKIGINDTNYALSQYEMALSYIGMEQYTRSQDILKDLLEYPIKFDFKQKVYVLLGNAYDQDKQPDKAIETYTAGLKIYPHQHNLYFNRAVCYEAQKKYPEALADYQAAIQGNMYHANSHLRLGLLAANQGMYDQALMSLLLFTWIDVEDSRVPSVVSLMEQIANGSYEKEGEKFNFYPNGDPYEEFNTLFENKTALQDNYKAKFTVSTDFAKQMHLFLKNNKYQKDNLDFWNQHYMPFYEAIWNAKKLDYLILVSLVSFDNAAIQSKIKSKLSKIKAFYSWSKDQFSELTTNQYMEFEGKKQFIYVDYDFNNLDAIGKLGGLDGKTPTGNFYYYHPNGLLKMIAHLDDSGKPTGTWEIFNEYDGTIERKVEFVDAQTKVYYDYYFTGELYQKYKMVGDYSQDTVTRYFRNGTIREKYVVKDGVKNGPLVAYFPNGGISYKINYTSGKGNGNYISYHPNGEIEDEFTLKDDNIQGVRKQYYPNKQLKSEYTYVDDLYEGAFKTYFSDGKVEETGSYKKGKQVGLSEEFFTNGVLSISMTLDESGKQNGKSTFYDLDGKKYHEFEFAKGELVGIYFTDKSGKTSELAAKKGKKIDYIRNFPNGVRNVTGQIVDGESDGKWEYFDTYGNLWKVEKYKNGQLIDSIVTYYSNGQRHKVHTIKDGQKNGLYLEYNIFGDLITEGYYTNDEPNKDWISYRFDGTMEGQSYFVEGTRHGIQKDYAPNGKMYSWQQYDMGRVISNIYTDTLDNIIDEYPEYNGEIRLHSSDGKYIRLIAHYKNGNADGSFKWFNADGSLSCEGQYINDERTGTWKWYHLNGKLAHEVAFVNGEKDGPETFYNEDGKKASDLINVKGVSQGVFNWYHSNGKVSLTGSYMDDERHGKVTTYNNKGEVMMIRYYNQGVIESYSYLGTDGKEITPIQLDSKEMHIVCYYKNGKKSTEHYRKNGLIEGTFTEYYENGQKSEENFYLHDEGNGTFVEYAENGVKLKELTYVKGELHGFVTEYYANGKMKSKTPYLFGEKHGKAYEYNADGKLIQIITYYNDDAISIQKM
jgi:antitoxin component YwqK of YwqJK toxin-antitoxin module